MNTQRWLALGLVSIIVIIIATAPQWLARPDTGEITQAFPTFESTQPVTEALTGTLEISPPLPAVEADEPPAPDSTGAIDAPADAPSILSNPFIVATGTFAEIDAFHVGQGGITIFISPDGSPVLRLEPFNVTPGPDLRVALAGHPAPRTANDLASSGGLVELGLLASYQGTQDYPIPVDLRLEQFESVVIYSKSFDVIFTTATLLR